MEEESRDLSRIFSYHSPSEKQIPKYQRIRDTGYEFAVYLKNNCPKSVEADIALQKIEEAVMWANAAIARN